MWQRHTGVTGCDYCQNGRPHLNQDDGEPAIVKAGSASGEGEEVVSVVLHNQVDGHDVGGEDEAEEDCESEVDTLAGAARHD